MRFQPRDFDYDNPSSERAADEILVFGDWRRPRSEIEAILDEMLSSSMRRDNPVIGPVLRREDRIYHRVWDLLGMPAGKRRRATGRPPYRDLFLADLLIAESTKAASQRPAQAEQMALLAEWIADRPWPGQMERARQVRVRAFICQGNARRLLRDGAGAELRFAAAFSLLEEMPVAQEHVTFCESLASLREDLGRYDEAAALLWQAATVDARLWAGEISAPYLARLGLLALKQNDPALAMTLLTRTFTRAEPGMLESMVRPRIDLGRAVCLAAVGLAGPARLLLEEARESRRLMHDRDRRISLEWLECRVAIHIGDLDRAVPRLEAVRRWLLDRYRFVDVCLCTLDLALAYAKRGEASAHLPRLLAEVAGLDGAEERPWALEMLRRFREALEREGRDPVAAAREAAEIARRRETSAAGSATG